MQNIQSLQSINSAGKISGNSTVTLQSYIKSIPALVAYYPLDESTGTTAFNRAPATSGTLDGVNSNAVVGQAGQSGLAYDFEATSSSHITVPDNASLNSDPFSIFALFNAESLTGNDFEDNLINKEGANSGYALRIGGGTVNFMVGSGSGTPQAKDPDVSISTGTWYWAFGVYDGTDIKVYLNDELKATTESATYSTNSNDFSIGYYEVEDARFFDGLMQHVGYVADELSIEQMDRMIELSGL